MFLISVLYLSDIKNIKIVMIITSDFHLLIVMIIWDLKFCVGDFGILFLCTKF